MTLGPEDLGPQVSCLPRVVSQNALAQPLAPRSLGLGAWDASHQPVQFPSSSKCDVRLTEHPSPWCCP